MPFHPFPRRCKASGKKSYDVAKKFADKVDLYGCTYPKSFTTYGFFIAAKFFSPIIFFGGYKLR